MSIRFGLYLLVMISALILAACQPAATAATPIPTTAPSAEPTQPAAPTPAGPPVARLRIQHNGGAAVEKLVVIFPEGRVEFGPIQPGETTEYKEVPGGVYAYAAYETTIDGKLYQQPVIDWVGEQPVEGKSFTWLIDVEPNRGQMEVVQLVKATVDE